MITKQEKLVTDISTQIADKLLGFIASLNEIEKIVFIQYHLSDNTKTFIIQRLAERTKEKDGK